MRGRIALPKHVCEIRGRRLQDFAELLECARVLASLFRVNSARAPETILQREQQNELK
jgi:hypothetical protein